MVHVGRSTCPKLVLLHLGLEHLQRHQLAQDKRVFGEKKVQRNLAAGTVCVRLVLLKVHHSLRSKDQFINQEVAGKGRGLRQHHVGRIRDDPRRARFGQLAGV